MRTYESVVVLGGGLCKDGDEFRPATYDDSDEFGMLGGHMRIVAALGMYMLRRGERFLFSGGTSAKLTQAFGSEAPIESVVYRDTFLDKVMMLAHDPDHEALCAELAPPLTMLDPEPPNTAANMQRIGQFVGAYQWRSIAVITNEYHVPRAQALWRLFGQQCEGTRIDFVAAEAVVSEAFPGQYEAAIEIAYQSEAARKRLYHEANGLEDIRSGRLVPVEFQLAGQH